MNVRALWRFVAGDSRVAPIGIAVACIATAIAGRAGWSGSLLAIVFTALLVVTLAAAAFER